MLDSPTKKTSKAATNQGQVLWRGSHWLLLKPGEEILSLPRGQSMPNKKNLDELAADLQNDVALRSDLKKALCALDEKQSAGSFFLDEDTQEHDVLEIILYIMDFVKSGHLLWLPADAADTLQDTGDDSLETLATKDAAQDDPEKGAAPPPKTKPKKILKRKTTTRDNSGPQTPSQLLQSVGDNSADEAPPEQNRSDGKNNRKVDGKPKRAAQQTDKSSKPLIERFTNADATTGEPVSRWLAIDSTIVDGTALAHPVHKMSKKPGKLGNGKVSPKNARIHLQDCPVSAVSGEVILEQVDFEFPGPIPLTWRRVYRSSHSRDLGLGIGWTSLLLARLDLHENEIVYCDGEGRAIPFERLTTGKSCCNCVEQLTLYCDDTTVYRIIDADNTILTFGGSGKRRRLYEITDREGHAIKLFYSANDRLIQILDSAGRRLKLEYNITDQLRRIHLCDDEGSIRGDSLVEYSYNNDRELIKVIDANGNCQAFEYRHHLITKHTNKDSFNLCFEWDGYTIKSKCSRTWGGNNIPSYRFKYDEANKFTLRTDALGNTSEYHFNELGLITTEIDPESGVSQYTYNKDGRILTKRTPIGSTISYSYDSQGRLIRQVDAAGGVNQFGYDMAGNLVKFTNPLQQTWEWRYDNCNRLQLLKDAEGQVTQLDYSTDHRDKRTGSGRLCTVTDALGHAQRYEWNEKGELLSHTNAHGKKTRLTYDDLGRITKIIEAKDRTTHFSYDRRNNITQIIHPSGASVQMLYTAGGHLTQYVDAIGRTTRYKYDGLGRPVERCDPNGRSVFFEYDKQHRLTAAVNENGERYELQYDKNGRLVQETGFDRRIQKYNYNAAGKVVRHLDGANRVTSFKRDLLGRMLQKRTSTGEITEFEYDALGQLLKAYNSHCVLQIRYDGCGRIVGEIQNNQRIQCRYNTGGQKTHVSLPNGKTVQYDYDERGLPVKVSCDGKALCIMERDANGRETRRTTGKVSSQFQYDPMGRLTRQSVLKGDKPIWERQYRYDKTGNLRQIDDLNNGKVKFHFDNLDRLTKVEGAGAEEFTFDPAGNLIDTQYPEPRGYVRGNRLRVFQNFGFEYDDVGNMVRQFHGRQETRFYYNVANQLVRAFRDGQTTEYTYDPLGRRCKKANVFGRTEYLWDGDILIHELREDNRAADNAAPLSITYVYDPQGSRPICQIRGNEVYFYHTDHLGTPHLITDGTGDIVWRATYKSHGVVSQYEVEVIDNPLRLPGQYHDPETGLHYSRHRYYHPVVGRFIHQHPAGLKGGVNPYEYAPNPLGWVNPLGLQCEEVFKKLTNGDSKLDFKMPENITRPACDSVGTIGNNAISSDNPAKTPTINIIELATQ